MANYPTLELRLNIVQKTAKQISPLYPYGISNLRVIFLYGFDFTREPTKYGLFQFWFSAKDSFRRLVMYSCMFILYGLRRMAKIQHSSFSRCYLETVALFVGGGKIRARHKWERIFFSIALVGLFCQISLYLANFSMLSVYSDKFDRTDTFEKLAKRNVTFYYGQHLMEKQIEQLLKLEIWHNTI